MLRVGDVLYGYSSAYDIETYDDRRVEFIASDWVVVREVGTGIPRFYHGNPENLDLEKVIE